MTDPTAGAEPEPESETEETEVAAEPFLNRAERRAKGKKGAKPNLGATGQSQMRSGTVQSPRQYGNRRSG